MNNDLLDFIRGRLEEGEGIAPDALARLVAAARMAKPVPSRPRPFLVRRATRFGVLFAASLALVCGGWFLFPNGTSATSETDVTNVIALLQGADGAQIAEGASLAETLLSWQDAPCANAIN